jgi:hypothetical protein
MTVEKITFAEWRPDDADEAQQMRDLLKAVDLIEAFVHKNLVDFGVVTVANALCSVAANEMTARGVTDSDVILLFEGMTNYVRAVKLDRQEGGGKA